MGVSLFTGLGVGGTRVHFYCAVYHYVKVDLWYRLVGRTLACAHVPRRPVTAVRYIEIIASDSRYRMET